MPPNFVISKSFKFSRKLQRWCFPKSWFFLLVRLFASQMLLPEIGDKQCNKFKTSCKTNCKTNCKRKFQFFISPNEPISNQFQSHNDFQRSKTRDQATNKHFTTDKQHSIQLDTNQSTLSWIKMNFSTCTNKCFKKNGKIPSYFVKTFCPIKNLKNQSLNLAWVILRLSRDCRFHLSSRKPSHTLNGPYYMGHWRENTVLK